MHAMVVDDSAAMRSIIKPFTPDVLAEKLALLGLISPNIAWR